jgi:predicted PurR-regulated permease PerM
MLLIWSVFVGTLDNVLRPDLIKEGADLPLLLIFAGGVIGGLLSFGPLGVLGPVVLAVTYKLRVLGEQGGDPVSPASASPACLLRERSRDRR